MPDPLAPGRLLEDDVLAVTVGADAVLRDELLNWELFADLVDAKALATSWQNEYNHRRPRSAPRYQTPAAFSASCGSVADAAAVGSSASEPPASTPSEGTTRGAAGFGSPWTDSHKGWCMNRGQLNRTFLISAAHHEAPRDRRLARHVTASCLMGRPCGPSRIGADRRLRSPLTDQETRSESRPYTLSQREISVSFTRSFWLALLRSSAIAVLPLYGPAFARIGEDPSFLCLRA